MNIFFDHQIFIKQLKGGPSRYFTMLNNELNKIESINSKIYAPFHINEFLHNDSKKNYFAISKLKFSNFLFQRPRAINFFDRINNYISNHQIRKFNPDIIHLTYYNDYINKKRPIIVTVFDLIHEKYFKDYGFKSPIYPKKKILNVADKVICISNETKKDLKKFYNINDEKLEVVHLGVRQKFEKKFNYIDKPYILFVGTRWKYKNFFSLLKTLSNQKKILNDFKVVLFGGGELTKDEQIKIKNLNLEIDSFLNLNGNDEILFQLYSNARVLIYPSKAEGFGLPIIEAFSSGCPVVCSNIPVLKEVADNAAVYFDPNDTDSIKENLNKVLYSDSLRQSLIVKGTERVKSFTWNRCAEETLKVYKKL